MVEKIEYNRLKESYLDLFGDNERLFHAFVSSLEGDVKKIKKQLRELRKHHNQETYVYQNFDFWAFILKNFHKTDFPKVEGKARYFFDKGGKKCFRFKYFITDLLEAKAMLDCPDNPGSRYSMLKSELIKYIQHEKNYHIKPKRDDKIKILNQKLSEEQKTESLLSKRWDDWMKS